MNIATAEKIRSIAGYAQNECSLSTLKSAKTQLVQRTLIIAGYEHLWKDINHHEVTAAFEACLKYSRKADFIAHCELLSEAMEKQIAAGYFHKRVAHTIKIANRDYGVWVTAEQVIAAAAGNRLFNFTKVAKMLAEKAREASAADCRTDDEGNDMREWSGHTIECDHTEALALNELPTYTSETIVVFNLEIGMRIASLYEFHTVEAIEPCPDHDNKYRLFLRRNNGTVWSLDVFGATRLQISKYRLPDSGH
ncbi:hypothetical protein P9911_029575 [Klebsiella oxytoca]|uniref:hypothetical protein n=1 Tax=Klebsiella oxytoca TaxID=571 RepID=UPI00254EC8F4|nr:hypothetical protein [Klebsiella oxytoca]MEC5509954.1 hypothetical protein [Klebsiella oxytoca]